MGYDMHDLDNCPKFRALVKSNASLQYPLAYWLTSASRHRSIGGTAVGLWLREDCKEVVTQLADVAQAPLRVTTTMYERSKTGRPTNRRVVVHLTDHVVRAPPPVQDSRVPPPTSVPATAAPAPRQGSWAQRVSSAASAQAQKRPSTTPNVDHRPHKKTPNQSPSAPSSLPTPANGLPALSAPARQAKSSPSPPSQPASGPALSPGTPRSGTGASDAVPASPDLDTRFAALEHRLQEQVDMRISRLQEQFQANLTSMTQLFTQMAARFDEMLRTVGLSAAFQSAPIACSPAPVPAPPLLRPAPAALDPRLTTSCSTPLSAMTTADSMTRAVSCAPARPAPNGRAVLDG
jgi:hypothetical protein